MLKNFERISTSFHYDANFPVPENYLGTRLERELANALSERIAKGEAFVVIPLKGEYIVPSEGMPYYSEVRKSALISSFDVPQYIHPLLLGKMYDLAMDDKFIEVSNPVARHFHSNRQFLKMHFDKDKLEEADMGRNIWETHLQPLYNFRGEMLGMLGKCDECGKVFYMKGGDW